MPKYNILQHKTKHLEQQDWPRIRDREHTENRVEANCIWRRRNGRKCPLLIRMLSVMKCCILSALSKWNLTQPIIFTYISRIIIFVWKFIQIFTQCDTFIIFRNSCKWQFTLNTDYSLRSHIFTQEKRPSEFISVDTQCSRTLHSKLC